MTPSTIAGRRYEVESLLGRGGMGEIYLARDTRLDRQVAIKLLARELAHDQQLHARMHREALLAAQLSHPSLVAVLDAGEEDGRPYLVMEYVPGETLATRLQRQGPLTPSRVLAVGGDLAGALCHVHELGMVHRDVKPENVFLSPGGGVKLGDFGIARALAQPRMTEIGTILGTASYLAPELLAGGDATPESDVYALGVLLYECASGELPRRGATVSDLAAADARPLAWVAPGLPAELVGLVDGCLARDPAARPSTAEIVDRLRPYASESAPTLPRPTKVQPAGREAGAQADWAPPSFYRHRGGRLLLATVLLAVAAAIAFALVLTLDRGGLAHPGGGATLAPPAASDNPSLQARNLADWLRRHTAGGKG